MSESHRFGGNAIAAQRAILINVDECALALVAHVKILREPT
jgi:hypothetical protein